MNRLARILFPARVVRAVLAALLGAAALVLAVAAPAAAHNSFDSSEPADGAVLDAAPASVLLRFAKDVPLDTVQVLWIDETGARTELQPLTHGPGGATEVVAPVPAGAQGAVTVRWRLVGADGHVVSGRVGLTLPASPGTTVVGAGAAGSLDPSAAGTTAAPPLASPTDDAAEAGPSGTVRWILRLASFASMIVLGGVVVVAGWVWPRAWEQRTVRRLGLGAGLVLVAASFGLLLALAADLEGTGLLGGIDGVEAATRTDAGLALVLRVALSLVTLGVLAAWQPAEERSRWLALGGLVLVGLGTWSAQGHARTMRWSWLGVPLDVVHYAAAAAWLGGLVVLSVAAFRLATTDELVVAMRRFSDLAAASVAVIVATGAVQALRLVGGPAGLVGSTHGRVLLAKLAVLALMLVLADRNRRRVRARFRTADAATPAVRGAMRRTMGTEAVLGLAVLALTAALVATSPEVSEQPADDVSSVQTGADDR